MLEEEKASENPNMFKRNLAVSDAKNNEDDKFNTNTRLRSQSVSISIESDEMKQISMQAQQTLGYVNIGK